MRDAEGTLVDPKARAGLSFARRPSASYPAILTTTFPKPANDSSRS